MAANRALFEAYKTVLRREMAKPYVVNPKVKVWMDELWRPGATVGNGSTAAAARFERLTGGREVPRAEGEKLGQGAGEVAEAPGHHRSDPGRPGGC